MSLRDASRHRTLCEVLREINDILQGNDVHKEVLPLLVEAEDMGKRMIRKLHEYNKEADRGWWERNLEYEKDLLRRLDERYIA